MAVGTELRQARERAGLSIEEIGRRTKIQLYKIEALEHGDYDRLPQGIYLDGIVRSYSHEVMVDPEAMVNRVRLERGKLPGDAEIPFSAPIDLHGPAKPREVQFIDVPEIDDQLGSFATEKRSHAASSMPRAPIPPVAPVAPVPGIARVARKDVPIASHAQARIAHRRIGAVLPAIIVLATAFLGGYLYQSWRLHERTGARMSTTVSITPNEVTPNETTSNDIATPSPVPPQTSNDPRKAANPAVQPDKVATTGSLPNLAGSWTLNTKVESSSASQFAGLQLGYELRLEQKGDRITGVGRKVAENGIPINKRAQTPLSVSGTINGDRVTLNFVERGARRPSRGKFVLLLDDRDSLRGRFSSTAARSSGIVEAHRVPTP